MCKAVPWQSGRHSCVQWAQAAVCQVMTLLQAHVQHPDSPARSVHACSGPASRPVKPAERSGLGTLHMTKACKASPSPQVLPTCPLYAPPYSPCTATALPLFEKVQGLCRATDAKNGTSSGRPLHTHKVRVLQPGLVCTQLQSATCNCHCCCGPAVKCGLRPEQPSTQWHWCHSQVRSLPDTATQPHPLAYPCINQTSRLQNCPENAGSG